MSIKLSTKNLNIFFFDISQLGLLLSLCGASLGIATINSLGVWMIFGAVVGVSVLGISKTKENVFSLLLIIAIIVIAFISMLYSDELSYKNIVNLLSFLEIPLFIVFTEPIDSNRRIKSACFFAVLISVLYLYLFFSPRSHYYTTQYGVRIINDLTLGFSNPNETGIHLISCLSLLCAAVFFVKKKFLRVILLVDTVVISYFVVETLSRASILVGLLLIVMIIPVVRRKHVSKAFQQLCFLSPFFSFLIVLLFPNYLFSMQLFGETVDTGRVSLLLSRFTSLNFIEWIVGDYSYTFENSLNAYLSIFLTVGLIALIAFLVIIKYGLKTCNLNATTSYNKIGFLAVLMFIVHASVESANFVAGSFYAASFFGMYVIAIDNGRSDWLDNPKINSKSISTR